MPESSSLEFLEKYLANNFTLSETEDNTSGPFNWGGIPDLPLLRTLFAICWKSQESSFWEVMDSVLVAYASLAASRTLFQQLLACLNFTLDSGDLFCWYKQKKDFFWTMAAAQATENHGDEWGHSVHSPPFCSRGGGRLNLLPNFQKGGAWQDLNF